MSVIILVREANRLWILVDYGSCSGCRLCEIVCALEHEGTIWPEASRIRIFEEAYGAPVPHLCVQCLDYPCVKSCPVGALSVNEATGAVIVDDQKCIGCGKCIEACPGKVPRIPKGKKTVVICDLCNGEPKCVKICNEAGYNALKLYRGSYRPVFSTFTGDPREKSLALSKKMFD